MLRDVDLMSVDGLRVGQKKGTECHPGSEQKRGLDREGELGGWKGHSG